ncbi:Spermine synthase [Zea mays]|uniref:Spermine synthase n=1 Tax=Zea mays TaxID=4577 RepID=A0A1D6QPC4_MAIZE|nr:Spermine synthase [Zea mays]
MLIPTTFWKMGMTNAITSYCWYHRSMKSGSRPSYPALLAAAMMIPPSHQHHVAAVAMMHRAAFVLPTFARRELEAYCVSTETEQAEETPAAPLKLTLASRSEIFATS